VVIPLLGWLLIELVAVAVLGGCLCRRLDMSRFGANADRVPGRSPGGLLRPFAVREHRVSGWIPIYSGKGMNSASPGTGGNLPCFQSSFACSIRSLELETKFHQM
jgi:hypothetical protein